MVIPISSVMEYAWAAPLQINQKQIEDWLQELPAGKSLLLWCFENNYIKEADYLNWASEHYGLPILQDDFFNSSQKQTQNFSHELWRIDLQLVALWEDQAYVACLYPPTSKKNLTQLQELLNKNITFCLASFTNLKNLFQKKSDLAPAGLQEPAAVTPIINSIDFSNLFPADSTTQQPIPLAPIHPNTKAQNEPLEHAVIPTLQPLPSVLQNNLNPLDTNYLWEKFSEFEKSMILVIKNKNLTAASWSPHWHVDEQRQKVFELTLPSFFKIVIRSKAPFHGVPAASIINDAFIATFLNEQKPAWLTILPIFQEQKVTALFLGVCSFEVGKKIDLDSLQYKLQNEFKPDTLNQLKAA